MKIVFHYPEYQVVGMPNECIQQLCQKLRIGHEHGLQDVVGNHREFHEGALSIVSAFEKELKKDNTMRFLTHTGSVFEVDQENKLIRRIPRKGNPTTTKEDNVWRKYVLHTPIEVDRSVTIWWDSDDKDLTPTTTTSFITEICK